MSVKLGNFNFVKRSLFVPDMELVAQGMTSLSLITKE